MGFCQDWEEDYEGLDPWDDSCSPVKPSHVTEIIEEESPKPIKSIGSE